MPLAFSKPQAEQRIEGPGATSTLDPPATGIQATVPEPDRRPSSRTVEASDFSQAAVPLRERAASSVVSKAVDAILRDGVSPRLESRTTLSDAPTALSSDGEIARVVARAQVARVARTPLRWS